MTNYAVIGANYGDEGKGLIVDKLAREVEAPCVVRHNGTAQAAHRVEWEGGGHTFSHFGSGTVAGAPTWLTGEFCVHPAAFYDELCELEGKGFYPEVIVDPRLRVVTPVDLAVNRLKEMGRTGRHGSCGMGFYEAIQRHKQFPFTIGDLIAKLDEWDSSDYQHFFQYMACNNPYTRAQLEDITRPLDLWGKFYAGLHYLRNCEFSETPPIDKTLIFEGAQGLGLDEAYGTMPYCTPSNTGLKNVVSILNQHEIKDYLTPIYVTRTYLTRHGAGPLKDEVTHGEVGGIVKEGVTVEMLREGDDNKPNPWQENMRFAPLDVEGMTLRIKQDVENTGRDLRPRMAVTWCDVAGDFGRGLRYPIIFTSYGPRATDVE